MFAIRSLMLLLLLVSATNITWSSPLSLVVLEDNFNTSAETFNFDFEINTSRQSGLVAGTPYSELAVSDTGGGAPFLTQVGIFGGNALILVDADFGAASIWVSPDHNFVESPSFRVNVSLAPVVDGLNQDDWLAVTFGSATQGAFALDPGNVSLLITGSGGVAVFDGGTLVAGTSVTDQVFHDLEVDVTAPAFGSDAMLNITVDGLPVLSNYIRAGGFSDNFMTIGGFDSAGGGATSHLFDNVIVSVPEPSGLLLLCGACCAGKLSRRRS